ncbi:50S ribosomal protein 6 [Hibiscus syriacus]|uniref:50S ribosomal protein 6 n=1 Tax=Hibiscus syriacus TaxID=106335 RepID=A0A6A2YYZ0_HIBSY|nr:50S ribosomal protein 6 [Hibiscus syriacus]
MQRTTAIWKGKFLSLILQNMATKKGEHQTVQVSTQPEFSALDWPRRLESDVVSRDDLIISSEIKMVKHKKATKHHMKTRPRKTQPWDVRRKPTVYAPLPALPPDWTFVSSGGDVAEAGLAGSALQAPASRG